MTLNGSEQLERRLKVLREVQQAQANPANTKAGGILFVEALRRNGIGCGKEPDRIYVSDLREMGASVPKEIGDHTWLNAGDVLFNGNRFLWLSQTKHYLG